MLTFYYDKLAIMIYFKEITIIVHRGILYIILVYDFPLPILVVDILRQFTVLIFAVFIINPTLLKLVLHKKHDIY